jgi:hypothetical protein
VCVRLHVEGRFAHHLLHFVYADVFVFDSLSAALL